MESTSNKVQQEPGADNPRQREPSPERLVQLGLGFWASKTLLSAVELGVFSCLATGPRDAAELTEALGLHPRSALDFLDALVALNLLEREDGKYRNTPDAQLFLDVAKRNNGKANSIHRRLTAPSFILLRVLRAAIGEDLSFGTVARRQDFR